MTDLFENIKKLCDEQNTTVYKIAIENNMPGNTINNWKEERAWMKYLPVVSKILNVSIDELFSSPSQSFDEINDQDYFLQKIVSSLHRIQLTPKTTDAIIAVAQVLSRNEDNE